MKNRPTKNFYFNESVNFWFCDRDEFHQKMQEIETYFKERKFDVIPTQVRKIFEKILEEIIEKKEIKVNSKFNIYNQIANKTTIKDKIHAIADFCSLDYDVKMSLLRVNDLCNMGSHYNKKNEIILSCEILTLLKNFYIVLFEFLELEEQDENFKSRGGFEDIYSDINIQNIISSNEIEINKRKSTQYYPDISVQEINIANFLFKEKRKFIIPLYQRGYTWTENNVEDLFVDILARMKDKTSHYFGVVAGKLIDNNNVDIKEIKIIDGQQRLTTSVILVMACYYVLKEWNVGHINKIFEDIFQCLGDKTNFTELFKNPAGIGSENDAFRIILSGKWEKKTNPKIRYEINLCYLISKIKDEFKNDGDSVKEFMNYFLSSFTIALVDFNSISIDIKKELEIFENLNSKGKSLNLSELIKNYIFNLCDEKTLDKEQHEVQVHFSKKINAPIGSYLKDDNVEKKSEHLKNFYKYLISYFKGKEISNSDDNPNALLKDFKEYVISKIYDILSIDKEAEFLNIDEYKSVVNKLSEFLVKGYIPIKFNDNANAELFIYDFMQALQDPKKTSIYSLSFLFAEHYDNLADLPKKDRKLIFECYSHIIKIIIFHFIIVGQGDSDLRRFIIAKIKNIREELKSSISIENIHSLITKNITLKEALKTKILISREEIKLKISNISGNGWTVKILLLLISYHLSKDGGDPDNIKKSISLEHIMPQKLTHIWLENIRTWNNIDAKLTDKSLEEDCYKYINQLGNYLLVTKDLNAKLNNKPFANKRTILNNQNFIHNLIMNKNENIDISKKTEWKFKDIEERTEMLTIIAIELSKL